MRNRNNNDKINDIQISINLVNLFTYLCDNIIKNFVATLINFLIKYIVTQREFIKTQQTL